MSIHSFYHLESGVFHPTVFHTTDLKLLAQNTPPNYVAIKGRFDYRSQRVDLSGEKPVVIDYQPPAPGPDYEWNAVTKRWQLTAAVQAKIDARKAAIAQISQLEASQPRAVRDFILNGDKTRVAAIEAAVAELRAEL